MKNELIYYSFECLDCLYCVGAFYPEFPIKESLNHRLATKHEGKLIAKHKGFCLLGPPQ